MNQEFIQGITRAASQIPGPLIVPWPERGRADAMRISTAIATALGVTIA
jgi:hypothetical protein